MLENLEMRKKQHEINIKKYKKNSKVLQSIFVDNLNYLFSLFHDH